MSGTPAHEAYLRALLTGDRRAALSAAAAPLDAGGTVVETYEGVIAAAQYEIGRLWETSRITVADEHVATAITQFVLSRLYDRLPIPAARRGRALVSGVRGELHQVGGHMVADVLEADGWSTRFLGSDLPDADIVASALEHRPDLIALTVTMPDNLGPLTDVVGQLRDVLPAARILVGGGAFRGAPEAWRETGADGFGRTLAEARSLATGAGESPTEIGRAGESRPDGT